MSQNQLAQVDARIVLFRKCKVKEFDRFLGKLTNVNKYKHHELRESLLYYLYPMFKGILSEQWLQNGLLLQKGVKLLGGSTTKKVPPSDIAEAREAFKQFNVELMDLKVPIRYMTHAIIHIPDDVDYFGCGIERQSAWIDETFQGKMRQAVHGGNLPAEQIRNRLVQRFLYLLPTNPDGTVIDSKSMFEMEVKKALLKNSKERIVLSFKIGREEDPTKTA